jgi:chaperonin GroES
MKLQVQAGRVLVMLDAENQSSTIVIPASHKKYSDRGTVVAVGPGRRHIDGKVYPPELKVGDRVVVAINGAYRVEHEGARYVSVEAEAIVCVMVEDNAAN